MELSKIEDNYKRMTDEEIIRIVTHNSEGLRDEVYAIIENEIIKRKLNPDLLKALYSHDNSYSLEQIEAFANILRDLACPICNNKIHKLNASEIYYIKSAVLFTTSKIKTIVACPPCLDRMNKKAMDSNLALGWWGLPWGLLKTPYYLFKNYTSKNENWLPFANKSLLNFAFINISSIEAFQNDTEELNKLIKPE